MESLVGTALPTAGSWCASAAITAAFTWLRAARRGWGTKACEVCTEAYLSTEKDVALKTCPKSPSLNTCVYLPFCLIKIHLDSWRQSIMEFSKRCS
jgi:hypothetical protein